MPDSAGKRRDKLVPRGRTTTDIEDVTNIELADQRTFFDRGWELRRVAKPSAVSTFTLRGGHAAKANV